MSVNTKSKPQEAAAAFKTLVDAMKAQQPSPAAESPEEWEFTVKRDSSNLIQKITAKTK
jgi:hypothetical protein